MVAAVESPWECGWGQDHGVPDGHYPQDVARLIVERSTIMAHLFSKRTCSSTADTVLAALLSIFSRHVRRMRKSKDGEEVYSWVSPAHGVWNPPPPPRACPTHRLWDP